MKKLIAVLLAITLIISACSFAVYAAPDPGSKDLGVVDRYIQFTDTMRWGKLYLYAWNEEGNSLCGDWPGTQVTEKYDNGIGEDVYICGIPEGAEGIVLSNGTNYQTIDITDFIEYEYCWLSGETDALGHYLVANYKDTDYTLPTEPTEPATDTPARRKVLRITDNFGWGTAYMFAWDNEENALLGDYPGDLVRDTEVNEYGENIFLCTIPDDAAGVLITNGNGAQSADITDFTYDGYWFDGTKNDLGFYIPTGYRINDEPDPDPNPSLPYFYNTLNFTEVYEYAWDAQGNSLLGAWPGTELTYKEAVDDMSCDRYLLTIPEGAAGIIINDHNGKQTEDITDFNHADYGYWLDGSKNELGRYLVSWGVFPNPQPTETVETQPVSEISEPTTVDPDRETILEIKDNLGWGEANLYAWDNEGNPLLGEWPGTQVETGLDYYNQNHFLCHIPANAAGIVINNGKGAQSEDITEFDYDYYWFDGSKNNLGHYLVTPYYGDYNPTEPTDTTIESTTTETHNPGDFTLGDVSGDGIITVADATLVQQYAAEMITLDGSALAAADTNHDGIVTVADATLIQQYAAEMIDSF